MKKNIKKIISCLTAVIIMLSISGCSQSEGITDADGKQIEYVEIIKKPYKDTYYVGEEIIFEGGEYIVFYNDGSAEKVPMAENDIKDKITTKEAGELNVVVEYNKFILSFLVEIFEKNDIVSRKFLSMASGFRSANEPVKEYYFTTYEAVREVGKTENWQKFKLIPTEDIMILWLSFDIVPKTDLDMMLFLEVCAVDYKFYPELSGNKMWVYAQMINVRETKHIEIYFNAFEFQKNNSANNSHIEFKFFDGATQSQSLNENSFAICNLKIVPWPINSA